MSVSTLSHDTGTGLKETWKGLVEAARKPFIWGSALILTTAIAGNELVERLHHGSEERHQTLGAEAFLTAPAVYLSNLALRGVCRTLRVPEHVTRKVANVGGAIAGMGAVKAGQYSFDFDAMPAGGTGVGMDLGEAAVMLPEAVIATAVAQAGQPRQQRSRR
jgi:hypothetical protein